jgi:hypothetical protein
VLHGAIPCTRADDHQTGCRSEHAEHARNYIPGFCKQCGHGGGQPAPKTPGTCQIPGLRASYERWGMQEPTLPKGVNRTFTPLP